MAGDYVQIDQSGVRQHGSKKKMTWKHTVGFACASIFGLFAIHAATKALFFAPEAEVGSVWTQDDCWCLPVWDDPQFGAECAKDQHGCTNCDSDSKGNWCLVANAGGECLQAERDANGNSRGFYYCGEVDEKPECECMDSWSDSHPGCSNQNGCTNCDNDPLGSWCYTEVDDCKQAKRNEDGTSAGMFYCYPQCGCEQSGEEFCNWDHGTTGTCEKCPLLVEVCANLGLPEKGQESCEYVCQDNYAECGCEVSGEKFCNWDSNNSGFCEACPDNASECPGDDLGLHPQGVRSCQNWCGAGWVTGSSEISTGEKTLTKTHTKESAVAYDVSVIVDVPAEPEYEKDGPKNAPPSGSATTNGVSKESQIASKKATTTKSKEGAVGGPFTWTQDDCWCMPVWTDSQYGAECAKDQHGCTNCDNDSSGSWCLVANEGGECMQAVRDSNGDSRGFFYCGQYEEKPDCECMDNWTASDRAGCSNQNGCTNCDGDENGNWCYTENDDCKQAVRNKGGQSEGFFYCYPQCGCEKNGEEFCNWDWGTGGSCEACPLLTDHCSKLDLRDEKGVESCEYTCQDNYAECGCEVSGEKFCNWDGNNSGACEACPDNISECPGDDLGLHPQGVRSCQNWC